MKLRSIGWAVAFALCSLSLPVSAQQAPATIVADAGKAWRHKASGMVLPATIAGIARNSVRSFGKDEWDVAGVYELPGLAVALTVYVYQPAVQDASLWFAEAQIPVLGRADRYGKVTEFVPATPFAPTGSILATGLRATWSADGPFKSTALAVAPLGFDWIMKIRLSARDKSAAEVDALLTQTLSELKLPRAESAALAAPIAACATKLKPLVTAKPARNDGASALLGGLIPSMLADRANKGGTTPKSPPAAPFCKDDTLSSQLNVYRRDDAREFYVLSTGDSGRAAIAQRDELASLLSGSKNEAAVYSVQFVMPGETTVFGNYDRLPPPGQVIEIVNTGRWKSRTSRTAKGSNITLNSDATK